MNKRIRANTWMRKPSSVDFPIECKQEQRVTIKLIAKRRYWAIVCKWLLQHNQEPHSVTEIAQATGVNGGSVSWAVKQMLLVNITNLHQIKKLDKREKLYSINPEPAKLIVQRYLWLCSFQLLKTLPIKKDEEDEDNIVSLEELKSNTTFNEVMQKHCLSFQESIESLGLNSYVTLLKDRAGEVYGIELENLPLSYYKTKKKETEKQEKKVEPEEVQFEEVM